jgi:hypothetical protein
MGDTVRTSLINGYLEELARALGGIASPLGHKTATLIYGLNSIDLVERIALTFGLLMRLTVVESSGGKENALAWVRTPRNQLPDGSYMMPVYGSLRLRAWPASIHITPALLRSESDLRISVVAHELSHLILYSLCAPDWSHDVTPGHPLQNSEAAVDIVAMMLGYREFYIRAYRGKDYVRPTVEENVKDTYLTSAEVEYVYDELARRPSSEMWPTGMTGRAPLVYGEFKIGSPDKKTEYQAVPEGLIAPPWRLPMQGKPA